MDQHSALRERISLLFYFCAFALVSCLLLGGGTRGGFLSDAILQFLSLPALIAALWRIMDTPLSREMRLALAFWAGVLATLLAQLLPLPPGIWTNLPGRETIAAAYELIGRDLPWAPLSMSPGATWLSALSLLPSFAVFLGTLQFNRRERRLLSLVVLGMGLVSVFIGLMQVAQGPSSPLRFFEYTNTLDPVGFFANRNHFAALLYSLMLLATSWGADNATTFGSGHDRKKYETASSFGAGVLARFGRGSAVGGVSLRSQEQGNAAPGITTFQEWFLLSQEGSRAYAAFLSVIETCRRQKIDGWGFITKTDANARRGEPSATLPAPA